ncbi:MAG TPA: SigE family RNA polymerase sigma factor [Actinomycetota bacterium]|nr:SigE family RNA polymerase sigma factor [Actinomycetota bacterium]
MVDRSLNDEASLVAEDLGAVETVGFEEFFAAEHARLYSALCAVTGNTQEAEEIMQEAFLRLWERWERISSIEDPVGYLYRTAMNVFRQRLRRAKVAVRKAVRPAEHEDAYEEVDSREVVIQGLRALQPRQRAAVVLTSLRGFSSEEAAEMLGLSPGAVRMLATRGRASMRKAVSP